MLSVKKTAGGTGYGPPFVNMLGLQQIVVDVSALTIDEVDADGYLKPGVAFRKDGILITGTTSSDYIYAVNPEPQYLHLATIPPTNISLAADTSTVPLGMGTIGEINRDVAEDNMGRAYTANELAAFDRAGSHISLTRT